MQVTRDNVDALVHFWRVIGHMIGIEDKYNLCTNSWPTTKLRLEIVLAEVYRPNLQNTPADFLHMATALLNGLWCFNPFLTAESFIYFTKMMSDCDGYVYMGSNLNMIEHGAEATDKLDEMHWYSRLILWFQFTMHCYLLNFVIIRWYMNSQIHVSTFIIHYFPFLAIFKFGVNKSYVRILRGDKSS